jgi:hypothetical protein
MKIALALVLLFFSAAFLVSADTQLTRDMTAKLAANWTICSTQQLAEQYVSHASEQQGNGIGDQGLGVRAAKGTKVKIVDTVPGYSQVQIIDGPSAGYVGWIFGEVLERY